MEFSSEIYLYKIFISLRVKFSTETLIKYPQTSFALG